MEKPRSRLMFCLNQTVIKDIFIDKRSFLKKVMIISRIFLHIVTIVGNSHFLFRAPGRSEYEWGTKKWGACWWGVKNFCDKKMMGYEIILSAEKLQWLFYSRWAPLNNSKSVSNRKNTAACHIQLIYTCIIPKIEILDLTGCVFTCK